MPDISIIVPIYNAEKYLNKCLDSLLGQTKKELEFILVNDGSTDSTEEIIKSYKDKRIKYFKNKNQGIGKTRNFALSKATGKYIMFLDSDDYLEPVACSELFAKAESENADLVVCDFYKVYEDQTTEEIILTDFENTSLKDSPNLLFDINLAPWNKIYKKDLITKNKIKFVENLKYEDVPFVAECFKKAHKISKVNKSLNYYVIHGNSETTVRDKRCFDIIKIVDLIRNLFKDDDYMRETVNKLTVRILTNYTIQQRNQKENRVGLDFINKAFTYLEKEVPDYKNNKYYEDRGFLRRSIEKNKTISKAYCSIYHLLTEKTPNTTKEEKLKNITETPSMQLSIMLLSYFFLILFFFTVFQFLKINSILGFINLISIVLPLAIYLLKSSNNKKSKCRTTIFYLLIILLTPFIFNKTYDLTFDGNSYHKSAIAYIKNGWNPFYETASEFETKNKDIVPVSKESVLELWIEHYPKATWIIAATIYNMTGNIESGKCLTFILTLVLLLITYNCLKTILSRFWSFAIACLIILNPVTIVQLFSYYLDSIMGICFAIELILLLLINPMKKQSFLLWTGLLGVCAIFVNLKFTGLLYSGILAATLYFYWIFRYHKESNFFKKFLVITRNFIIVFSLALFFIGANSYIRNTIDHKNPLYPLIGKDKVDIISSQQPKFFEDLNGLQKFTWSLFSESKNIMYFTKEKPQLKYPFEIHKNEIHAFINPDVRIGGFGPFFALIIILSTICLIVSIIKLIKHEKSALTFVCLSAIAIIVSMIAVGEAWWARYVPQFYLVPIGAIILMLYSAKYYKKKIIPYLSSIVVVGAIILNILTFAYSQYILLGRFISIEKDLVVLKEMDNPTIKIDDSSSYGYLYNLKDKNIDYQQVKEFPAGSNTEKVYNAQLEVLIND